MCRLMEWKGPTWPSVGNTRRSAAFARHIWGESWSLMQVFCLHACSINRPLALFYFIVLNTISIFWVIDDRFQHLIFPLFILDLDDYYDRVAATLLSISRCVVTLFALNVGPSIARQSVSWNPDTGNFWTGDISVYGGCLRCGRAVYTPYPRTIMPSTSPLSSLPCFLVGTRRVPARATPRPIPQAVLLVGRDGR